MQAGHTHQSPEIINFFFLWKAELKVSTTGTFLKKKKKKKTWVRLCHWQATVHNSSAEPVHCKKWTTSISQHGHIGWGREDGVITYSVRESMLTDCLESLYGWNVCIMVSPDCQCHRVAWYRRSRNVMPDTLEGHGSCEHQHWKQWMPCSAILNYTTPWAFLKLVLQCDGQTQFKCNTSHQFFSFQIFFFTCIYYTKDRCRVVWIKFHGQCHGLQSALKNTLLKCSVSKTISKPQTVSWLGCISCLPLNKIFVEPF